LLAGVVVLDVILVNVAFALAYWIRYDLQWIRAVDPAYDVPYSAYGGFVAVLTVLLLVAYAMGGVYNFRRGITWFDKIYPIVQGTATGIVMMLVFAFFFRPLVYSRLILVYAGILITLFLSISRLIIGLILDSLRRRGFGVRRVLIVGAGEIGRTVMRTIVAQPELGYEIVGFVDDNPEKGETDIGRFKALGSVQNLPRLVSEYAADEVIITLPWMYHRKIMAIMAQCERQNVRARLVPDLFQLRLSQVDVDDLGGIPTIGIRQPSIAGWNLMLKRAIDFSVSLLGLVLLAPLMALIALAIKLDSPGPVLFRQERLGKGGVPFTLYKFRSMRQGAETEQEALRDLNEAIGPLFKIRNDPRLTRVGRFLRRTSLDELPQLYNVLRGEMSLVGPRPPLASEVAQYQEWHKRRLDTLPGMTGLWQVSGRSELTFDEMCLLDIHYIENWSLKMDVQIFLRTIPRVLFGDGAY